MIIDSRPSIYVVGYPRSGNTWLSWLLADALDSPFTGKFFAIPIGQEGLDRTGEYVIRQLHLIPCRDRVYPEAVPDAWTYSPENKGDEHIIHIVRDPRDVAMSVMHYWGKKTLVEAITAVGKPGLVGGASWLTYVSAWLNESKLGNIRYTSYEELHDDTVGTIAKLLESIGAKPTHNLNDVVERQSLANKRQQIEQEEECNRSYNRGIQRRHLHKGKVGLWRDKFSLADKRLTHEFFDPLLCILGYEEDENWWK